MKNIVIFGTSGYSRVVLDIIENEKCFHIAGLSGPNREEDEECFGYPVMVKDDDLSGLIDEYSLCGGIVAVGDNYL